MPQLSDYINLLHKNESELYESQKNKRSYLHHRLMQTYTERPENSEYAIFSRTLNKFGKHNILEAHKIFRNGPGSHSFRNDHLKSGAENRSCSYIHHDITTPPVTGCGILICSLKNNVVSFPDGGKAIFTEDANFQEIYHSSTTLFPKKSGGVLISSCSETSALA